MQATVSTSLVQGEHNRNKSNSPTPPKVSKSCGYWTLHLKGNNTNKFVRLGCKRWTCPRCGPKKVRKLRYSIIQAAEEMRLRRFLTLTLDQKHCSRDESVEYIKKCWSKFRIYLKRFLGKNLQYILIVEFQKNGYAHLHILLDSYIPQDWIVENWQACGGGFMVDIRYIDMHRISSYLTKYLSKEAILGDFRVNQRRYTTSRDIKFVCEKIPGLKAKLIKKNLEYIFSKFPATALNFEVEPGGEVWAFEFSELIEFRMTGFT